MTDTSNVTIYWAGPDAPPAVLDEVLAAGTLRSGDDPCQAELILLGSGRPDSDDLADLTADGTPVLLLGETGPTSLPASTVCLPADISADQLHGAIRAAAALAGPIRQMQAHVTRSEELARQASRTADDLDEEMRLAARLQQDFLPRSLPCVGPVQFAVRYHSAGWVSGDIYDVARLDETHVGFYVADAVGHGLPAALLTMFIKKALQTKRISGNSYEIVPPAEAMGQLNSDLCRQQLTMCEFCTAVYGVIDTQSLRVTLARGGHPEPILIHPDGSLEELAIPGSLLGIIDEASFEDHTLQLAEGDRLVLFSDGAEDCLCGRGRDKHCEFTDIVRPLATLPSDAFLQRLCDQLPDGPAYDDVTLLTLDVQGE